MVRKTSDRPSLSSSQVQGTTLFILLCMISPCPASSAHPSARSRTIHSKFRYLGLANATHTGALADPRSSNDEEREWSSSPQIWLLDSFLVLLRRDLPEANLLVLHTLQLLDCKNQRLIKVPVFLLSAFDPLSLLSCTENSERCEVGGRICNTQTANGFMYLRLKHDSKYRVFLGGVWNRREKAIMSFTNGLHQKCRPQTRR